MVKCVEQKNAPELAIAKRQRTGIDREIYAGPELDIGSQNIGDRFLDEALSAAQLKSDAFLRAFCEALGKFAVLFQVEQS